MKIKEIDIKNIGCIRSLHLNFNENMNIICGPNSIGKTTIIESVASMFMYGRPTVKRNVASETGSIHAKVEVNGSIKENSIKVEKFDPNEFENTNSFTVFTTNYSSIFYKQ